MADGLLAEADKRKGPADYAATSIFNLDLPAPAPAFAQLQRQLTDHTGRQSNYTANMRVMQYLCTQTQFYLNF